MRNGGWFLVVLRWLTRRLTDEWDGTMRGLFIYGKEFCMARRCAGRNMCLEIILGEISSLEILVLDILRRILSI